MPIYITPEEAEIWFEELIEKVELGETIVVTRNGKPVVDFRPHNRNIEPHEGKKAGPLLSQE